MLAIASCVSILLVLMMLAMNFKFSNSQFSFVKSHTHETRYDNTNKIEHVKCHQLCQLYAICQKDPNEWQDIYRV